MRSPRLHGRVAAAVLATCGVVPSARSQLPAQWADLVMTVRPYINTAEGISWHSSGEHMLVHASLDGEAGLWTVSQRDGTPQRLARRIGAVPFLMRQHHRWSPDGEHVAFVSDKGSRTGQPDVWVWSARNGIQRQVTHVGARIGGLSWSPDGRSLAIASAQYGDMDIVVINVQSGVARRVTDSERYETAPVWLPDGSGIVYMAFDQRWVNREYSVVRPDGGGRRVIVADTGLFDYNAGTSPNVGSPQLSPDGALLLFLSWRSGHLNYWRVPLAGGEPVALAAAAFDQSNARWSPDGRTVLYVENHDGTLDLRAVPRNGGTVRVLVAPDLGVVRAPEWSPDGRMIGFFLETPTSVADLYALEVLTGTRKRLTRADADDIVASRLVRPVKLRYTSKGDSISAYVYLPKQQTSVPPPLIVFAHGGPTSQYLDSFEMQMQYFVGLGYAVVAPNFRGSSGYGKRFTELNDGCWAHCDLEDLIAGAREVGRRGWADTTRVGITGTSHGGLLSMAAATFADGFFRAAIPHGGTADRIYYYQTQELRHVKQIENELGPFAGNEAKYRYVSPFYWVSQVDTPIFVVWGEGRWPGSQNSRRFVDELERQYKPHSWKVYQGEMYYVSGRENTKQMLLDMTAFFTQHLSGTR